MSTVVSTNGQRAYVAEYGSGTVSVIDTSQEALTATIQLPAGAAPWSLALSPDGSRLYVADSANSQLDVVDTSTDAVVDTVDVGSDPWAVVATGDKVFTADDTDNTITVVDAASDQVSATIASPVTNPRRLALVPNSNLLYVMGEDSGVSMIDTTTDAVVRTQADFSDNADIAVSPDGSKTYVLTLESLDVLDTATGTTLASVPLSQLGLDGKYGEAATVAPDGRVYVFADDATDGALVAVDPTTLTAVSTTAMGAGVVQMTTGTIAATPPPSGKADVQTKLTGPASGAKGTAYTYTITAKDAGPGAAERVGATVLLPRGASLVSASGSYRRIGQLVVWKTTPDLAVNQTTSYTVTVRFSSRGAKLLTAGAASLSTPDPRLLNNVAVVSTRIR
jgi:YVTN family beta-propeller protein